MLMADTLETLAGIQDTIIPPHLGQFPNKSALGSSIISAMGFSGKRPAYYKHTNCDKNIKRMPFSGIVIPQDRR